MRYLLLPVIVAVSALAGCGNVVAPNAASKAAPPPATGQPLAATPEIRALVPSDIRGDGRLDGIVHPSLRRLLVQAPAGTGFSLTRGGVDVPFTVTPIALPDNKFVHELDLEAPLGSETLTLRCGAYTLSLRADAELGAQQPLIARPVTAGALSNDLALPTGAVFPNADDVVFTLSGALPKLGEGALVLRSGQGAAVPLQLSAGPDGIRARPTEPLEPRRVYALEASGRNPYGEASRATFRLYCRGSADRATALKVKQADLNRDGEPELVALFADGAITALTHPAGRAEGILPRTDETAIDFTVGDFDGNGAADVAVLLQGKTGYRLVMLYNQTRTGDASFAMQSEALEFESPIALASADFDRDGRDDIAVLDAFGEVQVRYSSRPPATFAGLTDGALAVAMVSGDANGDGKPDLYVLGADGSGRLFLNIGRGSFGGDLPSVAIGFAGAQRVSAGELDGDRAADLIFTGRGATVSVAYPALDTRATFRLNGETERLAGAVLCRDVNGDTRNDILLAREDDRGFADEVAIYLNSDQADGSPDAILPMGVRVRVHGLEFWQEHVVFATSSGLLVLQVNCEALPPTADTGVRFIEAYSPVPPIAAPLSAALADFNDDGRTDMATIDRDGNLQVWLSGADGEPFTPSGDPIALGGDGILKAIDFDRDNSPDLLFIPNNPNLRPRLLRNNRAGRFDTGDEALLPTPPSNLRGAPAMGDFDRDGRLDLLWPSPLGWLQFREPGSRWTPGEALPRIDDEHHQRLQFSGELCCADFTGNGIEDVVAVMQATEGEDSLQYLVLFEGTGSRDPEVGAFRATISTRITGRIFGLSPADFNGNGKLDLAVGLGNTRANARLTLLQLGPDRQFRPFAGAPVAKGKLLDLALDDLDRDGDLDLIASEELEDGSVVLTLWINDGRGNFAEAGDAQASLNAAVGAFRATNLSLADFTGDGRPDLLAIDRDGNVVIVRTTLP